MSLYGPRNERCGSRYIRATHTRLICRRGLASRTRGRGNFLKSRTPPVGDILLFPHPVLRITIQRVRHLFIHWLHPASSRRSPGTSCRSKCQSLKSLGCTAYSRELTRGCLQTSEPLACSLGIPLTPVSSTAPGVQHAPFDLSYTYGFRSPVFPEIPGAVEAFSVKKRLLPGTVRHI